MGFRLLVLVLGVTVGISVAGRVHKEAEKIRVFNEARAYAKKVNKPVLNAGCGSYPPYGDVNLNHIPRSVPNFVLGNIENMPFEDKEFGACVASHVLEHVDNPEKAYQECCRVAERVYVINPPLWAPQSWLEPTHKWLVLSGGEPKFIQYNPVGGWALLLSKVVMAWGI